MRRLEKRIAALEPVTGRTIYDLSDAELDAVIDEALAKEGTTRAQEIAKHGSLEAALVAMLKEVPATDRTH